MSEDLKTKVLIGGDISGLTAAFAEAASSVKEGAEGIRGGFESIGGALESVQSKFLAFAAGAGAIAGLAEFVHATVEASDATRRLSLAMGTSLENSSVLRSALASIGASSEGYVGALDHLARQLRRNEEGIQSLGIATRNTDGTTRDSQAVMQDALRTVQQYKPGLDQTQAAMYLFGRSVEEVRQLMPLLNVNMDEAKAKAQALGLILSGEQVAAVNRYKVSLNESKEVVEGAFNAIGQKLIPVLTDLQNRFVEAAPSIIEFAKNVGDVLVTAVRAGVTVIQTLVGTIQWWATAAATAGTVIYDALSGREGWSKIRADWQAGMEQMDDISKTTAAKIKATWTDVQGSVAKSVDPLAVGASGSKGWTDPSKLKDALTGRDAILRAQLAGEVAIVKEYDSAQEAELKRSYAAGLTSIKDYYTQRLALVTQTIDTEIAVNERLQKSVEEQKRAAQAGGDEKGVQAALAETAKLQAELIVLQNKRADAARASSEEQADAERALAAKIETVRLESQKRIKDDALDAQKAIIEAEARTGQISGAAAVEAFRTIEKAKYDIAVEYATKRAALEKDQTTAQEELQSKLAGIYADYQKKDTQITVENIKQRKDLETQAIQDVQNDFATALDQIEGAHKKLTDVIKGFFTSLISQMQKLANEEIANSLFGGRATAGSAGGAGGGGLLSQLFGGGGGGPGVGGIFGAIGSLFSGGGAAVSPEALATAGVFEHGTPYVPTTGLAWVHKGERVLTRQENAEGVAGGGNVTVHNHFDVPAETTFESRAAIASQVGRSIAAARRNW